MIGILGQFLAVTGIFFFLSFEGFKREGLAIFFTGLGVLLLKQGFRFGAGFCFLAVATVVIFEVWFDSRTKETQYE